MSTRQDLIEALQGEYGLSHAAAEVVVDYVDKEIGDAIAAFEVRLSEAEWKLDQRLKGESKNG